MKQSKKGRQKKTSFRVFNRKQLGWYYLLGILIVVGGVMSFGLIGSIFLSFDEASAVAMVYVIIPMSVVMYISISLIMRHLERKIGPLLTGIHRIAEGDLSTQLDLHHADEYTEVYREFNSMAKELQATKDEMQEFINEFTHEFKTPITSISGFADLLCEAGEELTPEEREEYLHIIAEQSRRLAKLSQNSLLLSKVEATQILTDKAEYSLSGQLQQCALLFLKQMDEKQITLHMDDEIEILYTGNAELMEHVWINLIGNALKFTPDGGTISISELQTENEIRIGIRDTGKGMSEDTIAHIFEKYYQNDTTSMVKGNGIGLAIVHRIVELSGGRIEVQSAPGKGSCFTVILQESC